MIIADKLKETNRAEYLLYMWQVEDIIRAFGCDADRIAREYLTRFGLDDAQRKATENWYANLCEMMTGEGKKEKGHLQICQNILQELQELHNSLVGSSNFPYYREMYYKVLPYVVELRAKNAKQSAEGKANEESELQTCFDFLYGVLMLRLQKKAITPETEAAMKSVTAFLGQLSDYYFRDKQQPLEF